MVKKTQILHSRCHRDENEDTFYTREEERIYITLDKAASLIAKLDSLSLAQAALSETCSGASSVSPSQASYEFGYMFIRALRYS